MCVEGNICLKICHNILQISVSYLWSEKIYCLQKNYEVASPNT